MNAKYPKWAATLLASACATLAACGSDGSKTSADKAAARTLKQPLQPRCQPTGYTKKQQRRAGDPGGQHFWSLSYRRTASSKPNAANLILVVQYPPATPQAAAKDWPKHTRIAGRQVSYRPATRKANNYAAHWRTERAVYTILADGTAPTPIRQLISCLP